MNIYQEHGYGNRKEYLKSLVEEYNIPLDIVLCTADMLEPNEDFDGLISCLEDYEEIL